MISLVQHNVIFWQTRTQDVVTREHITNLKNLNLGSKDDSDN